MAASAAAQTATPNWQSQFARTTDEYFDQVYFHYAPSAGTQTGFHQYDAQLEDFSRQAIDAEIAALKSFEQRIEAITPDNSLADFVPRSDRDIVLANIRSQLLTLETIRPWEKRRHLLQHLRQRSLRSHGAQVRPARRSSAFARRPRKADARPPCRRPRQSQEPAAHLHRDRHRAAPGQHQFLPARCSRTPSPTPKTPPLKAEFAQSNAAVIAALTDYLDMAQDRRAPALQRRLPHRRRHIQQKTRSTTRWSTFLSPGCSKSAGPNMRKNQEHFKQIAAELEPGKDPRAVLEELGEQHPAPAQLLDSFRATFNGLVDFIKSHHIVTIPSDVRPILEETPPFMRATTTASMDTPGPYETHSTEAYFNVTLPDPSMTPAEVDGYMHGFNIGTLISTAVHEAYPGHYVQFLWLPQAPSKVRKLLGANTDVEGWAHYCEQMMLDEGYGQPGVGAKDERESKFLRLGQLQDALLRNARFIVGIQMHTGNMTIEQAEEFFQKEGYQSKETAIVETKRGAGDPTYLYYTLGKLEIMKLRDDMKKKEGTAFSLEKFHDDFLRQGFPPIKIVREAMLGDNSPTL